MTYNFTHFSENFNPELESSELQSAIEQLTIFFESVNSASVQYGHLLELAEERAGVRLQELKGISPKELCPYWEKYGELGRALFWLRFNNPKNNEEVAILEDGTNRFQIEMTKSDTLLYSKLKKTVQSLSVLADKAKEALIGNKPQELKYLKETALTLDSDNERYALIQLIEAMEADLENQNSLAFDRYLLVKEPLAQHIALQQALNLAIKSERYQDALMVLEGLCRFSLDYMVPYAEMIDLLGNTLNAVDVLKIYLMQKPQQYLINLKLATLYLKLQDLESSRQVLNLVLSQEPDNKTAQYMLLQLNPT
ncbi:tetratricopeptide repeat protein [Thiomicrorhabdus aquaedulcis]|uniref:tetratricopeptide repeat protein n=1 Tax=Thiomicrorhabdus aquaedulcis TaxID=2211106 RepID=UPI000FD83CB3|nr:tetratricopeptide repeat protein [Thiomicrorhabdus aquaedulcis]